jgi:hypothetical protein
MSRETESLLNLRPDVFTENDHATPSERFQNEVLRPLLMFQHDLFVVESKSNVILDHCFKRTIQEEQRAEVKHVFAKNTSIKYQFIGMVTGLMTNEEFQQYQLNKSDFDKRITAMVIERLIDSRR